MKAMEGYGQAPQWAMPLLAGVTLFFTHPGLSEAIRWRKWRKSKENNSFYFGKFQMRGQETLLMLHWL